MFTQQTIRLLIILFHSLIFTACGNTPLSNDDSQDRVIFEDAQEALNPDWIVIRGESTPSRIQSNNQNGYCVNLPVSWYQDADRTWHNPHEYHLPMFQEDRVILQLDVVGTGIEIPHYKLGVILDTENGKRTILWDSWYNHNALEAHTQEGTMVFPSPVELVRGFGYESTTTWSHFKVNLEDYLHYFEPENTLLEVETFVATGGNLDNISLTN